MEIIYQEIGTRVDEIIPGDWEKIYLYAEVLNDSTEVFFYFSIPTKEEFIYSNDIPKVYNVDRKIYKELLFELFDKFEELREEFRKNEQELWTNLTLTIDNSGKFKIEYNYEDILSSEIGSMDRQIIWMYKNLGILPDNEVDKKFLDNYLKNIEDK
ncbi:TIGR01741 family protein [Bacillus cereus]|nr:TIGR01741 family protein [Bacillus cereus]QWH86388.1 TIGR01741 family protein [Bacillus mycoides]PET05930.1 TIGR01741 family protein [Bacillus cereus]PFF37625.1 TIGR01741 family protein [Bacillus cereus]PFI48148.1 TIGR01741 family protein [Bacillus cereus]